MTYRELWYKLAGLTSEQLDKQIIVELGPEWEIRSSLMIVNECWKGELRICGIEHNLLPYDYPVIFVK